MKTHHLLFSIFLPFILLMLADCTKEPAPAKAALHEAVAAQDNFVSIGQVLDFAAKKHPLTKASGEPDFDVAPYCSNAGDTLLYIVNYGDNDGWQILSSDARTPAVIAEGETGSFSLTEGSPAVQVWLDCTAQDIAAVRRASDSELNFSKDEIAANKQVWGMRGDGDLEPITLDEGYWDFTVSTDTIITEERGHMLPKWHQDAPYNAYCPLKSNSTTDRAPAGCVAVAGAQTMYYLHSLWGVPSTMYSTCICTGYVHNYSRSFGNNTSAVWAQMDTACHNLGEPADAEAILIAYTGHRVDMDYDNDGSGASFSDLKTDFFEYHSISCRKKNYNADTVKYFLLQNQPVIVSASNLLIPTDDNVHCFAIDGYRKTAIRYTYYHYFVPYHPNSWVPTPEYEPYYTYSQTTPKITQITINWGWESQWSSLQNEGWFGLTANWYVDLGNGPFNYNHNVKTIHGFHL